MLHRWLNAFLQSPDGRLWNVTANPGVGGATFKGDTIGGIEYPFSKIDTGAAGVAGGPACAANPLPVRADGSTGTTTSVSASAASTTVLAANSDRRNAYLFNDSTSACYVKFGATASSTLFRKRMLPFEGMDVIGYTGRIDAIWDSASGAMRVTEVTA